MLFRIFERSRNFQDKIFEFLVKSNLSIKSNNIYTYTHKHEWTYAINTIIKIRFYTESSLAISFYVYQWYDYIINKNKFNRPVLIRIYSLLWWPRKILYMISILLSIYIYRILDIHSSRFSFYKYFYRQLYLFLYKKKYQISKMTSKKCER